ncbi:hypothetical protein DFH29DRAFT_908606, partial [Suillus ampliporus]
MLVKGVISNRSVADFQQLCDRVVDWSASELCILQPVFYMHLLDPDCIPAKSTPAATTNIQLARWSLVGIVTTFQKIDDDSGTEARIVQHLISAWNRVAPWLVFFHNQFIMCRANYRPVDRTPAIKLIANILFYAVFASNRDLLFSTTPALYRPIVELWLLALETKDRDVLLFRQPNSTHRRITHLRGITSLLAIECMRDDLFVTIALEVSGDIGTITSAALKYVKSIRSIAKDPEIASTAAELLVPMFSCCLKFIAGTSIHSAAMRERYILRQSVKETFSTLRVLQSLLPGRGSKELIFKSSLASGFHYLAFLLECADDSVLVLHQALRSHAFETAIRMGPFRTPEEENIYPVGFFKMLYHYLVHDKILTYASKHMDAWSDALGPIGRQDKNLSKDCSAIERITRIYVTVKFKEEMKRRPSPNGKGWIFRCYCGGTAEDIQLRQCAGCQVVRYCSKRCQRDSWYAHHRLSCNFLKAAV